MKTGFSFRNKHSGEFGVTVRTDDRPVVPPAKESLHEASDMDGSHDFAETTGRRYYDDRTFKAELAVTAGNIYELQRKLGKIAVWLVGAGELVFDDIPGISWDARVSDTISYYPEHGGKSTVLSVTFKAKPFARLCFDAPEGPYLDDDIPLCADIPLDMTEYFTFTGSGAYTAVNIGDVYVKPVIRVSGSGGSVSVSCNGRKITVNASGSFDIDCEKEQVYRDTGGGRTSLMSETTGAFFELAPGGNSIEITGSVQTAEIRYTPKYIYDTDLSNTGLE